MSAVPGDGEFDIIHWPDEAAAVISDVKNHVKEIYISTALPSTDLDIYMNCETLENNKYTIRLSSDGFQIVSHSYDKVDDLNGYPYETPYAMLNEISSGYTNAFGNDLTQALFKLQQSQGSNESS